MGERPKAEPCPGIDGLKKEHDEFVRTKPTPQVLDWFLTGAATRTEHYEWAAYEGLITIARGLGETKVAGFLEQNLKQDKETLKEIQSVAKRFAREAGKKQETTTVETPAAARPTRKRTTGKRTGGTQSSRAKGTGTRTTGGRTGTRATGTRKGTSTGRRGTGRTTTRTGTASTTGQRTRP